MNTLGNRTRNTFFKLPNHGITHHFNQDGLKYTITLSADLVTLNVITGSVGATQIQRTYATSHNATMTALAADIAALDGVRSSTVTGARVITVYASDQNMGLAVSTFLVTLGASQATVVTAAVDNRVFPGQAVELQSTGKIQPVTAATADLTRIGIALDKARSDSNEDALIPEVVTVQLRTSEGMVTAQASIVSLAIGPVAYDGYDSVNKQMKVTSTSVTVTNQIGWAIEAGTNIGDEVKVILK